MVKLKTIVLLCFLLMFGKPLYAYTGFVYSTTNESLGLRASHAHEDENGYRIDFGLYPIGEGRFQVGAGFGEYHGSNGHCGSFNIKAVYFPVYVVLGTKEVLPIGNTGRRGNILLGLNTSYWHSVNRKLRDSNISWLSHRSDENYNAFQFAGLSLNLLLAIDNGDLLSLLLNSNNFYVDGALAIMVPTVGLGYYFK